MRQLSLTPFAPRRRAFLRIKVEQCRLDPSGLSSNRKIHRQRSFTDTALLRCKRDYLHVCTPSFLIA